MPEFPPGPCATLVKLSGMSNCWLAAWLNRWNIPVLASFRSWVCRSSFRARPEQSIGLPLVSANTRALYFRSLDSTRHALGNYNKRE
jgi:hypothetical protein